MALIIAQCDRAVVAARPADIQAADWQKLCMNARAIILKALRDDYWRVSVNDTPFEILRKIEEAFQPTSALIAILKLCKFFTLSEGIADGDIVKAITSSFSEMRRAIEASDALRGHVVIAPTVRTAILAFAIERSEPAAASQIKERFERDAITFEQAVSLLAEVRVTHRKIVTGTPIVNANTTSHCDYCNGSHPVSRCWFKDPSLAPERLRSKICKDCKKVGHATKDCPKTNRANTVQEGEDSANLRQMCFGVRHVVNSASSSSAEVFPIIMDSGCTIHMMSSRAMFSSYVEGPPESTNTVYTASGQPLPVTGHGSVELKIQNLRNGKHHVFLVSNVLHVSSLQENIISMAALDKKGIEASIGNGKMVLRHKGEFVALAKLCPRSLQYQLVHQS